MEHIAIPEFSLNEANHRRLSDLSEACHIAAAKGTTRKV